MVSSESHPNKRKQQADATRARLIEAAIELLNEKGEALSISEITERSGVSKALFYHYFESKESLLGLIQYEPYVKIDNELLCNMNIPILENIERYARAWLDQMQTMSPHFYSFWFSRLSGVGTHGSYRGEQNMSRRMSLDRAVILERVFQVAIDRGELAQYASAGAMSAMVTSALFGCVTWYCVLVDDPQEFKRMVSVQVDNILAYVKSFLAPGAQ